jgi:VWFA-related protein
MHRWLIRPALHGFACLAVGLSLSSRTLAQDVQPSPSFRSRVNMVVVDVVVRDRDGAPVRGLSADDFELLEDGKPQQILTLAYEEITVQPAPQGADAVLDAGLATGAAAARRADVPGRQPSATALDAQDLTGRRLWILLFDMSSMDPDVAQQAIDAALRFVDEQMTTADLVSVATIGSTLEVLEDFTNDKPKVRFALERLSATDTSVADPDAVAAADDAAASNASDTFALDAGLTELDVFNNDVRLRALRRLAEALSTVQQKKAIVYFSSGMQRVGTDNQVELRSAINAAVRANVAIYPVDARGLQPIIPGGSARRGSAGGVAAFSGREVTDQFDRLARQQETIQTLASDTGGTAFTNSNNLGEAFTRVIRDISSYYVLGYSSTNPNKDGRFRRISVRVKDRSGLQIEARRGYYAERDFAHTSRSDREQQLQEQLLAAIPTTDLPMVAGSAWFRLRSDTFYVPLSLALPGSAVPASADKITLDVAGLITDERGLPVGRIRDTLTIPPTSTKDLAARQVLYQTAVVLPAGQFAARLIVRENVTGQMGAFETSIALPDLKTTNMKVSAIVLGTQLRASSQRADNPLVRGGLELVPSVTRVVSQNQRLFFYYEVYDPKADAAGPQLRSSLTFYRGSVKVFETPVVERTGVDAAERGAVRFELAIPVSTLRPGLYTCQINIIDTVAGDFAFPRLQFYVR